MLGQGYKNRFGGRINQDEFQISLPPARPLTSSERWNSKIGSLPKFQLPFDGGVSQTKGLISVDLTKGKTTQVSAFLVVDGTAGPVF